MLLLGHRKYLSKAPIVFLLSLLVLLGGHPGNGTCGLNKIIVEVQKNGLINWTDGIAQARGVAAAEEKFRDKPQARQRAFHTARRAALETLADAVKLLRINAVTTVYDVGIKDPQIKTKLNTMINNAKIIDQQFLSDGAATVKVQMSLRGGFAQLVLPEQIQQIEDIKPVGSSENAIQNTQSAGQIRSKIAFTGIVVDATNINLAPAMSVTIFDESGEEVYGASYVSREFAVQRGMCGYTNNLQAAKQDARVAGNPMIVKALRAKGPGRSNVIISNADATQIRDASAHLTLLKECRVVIVID